MGKEKFVSGRYSSSAPLLIDKDMVRQAIIKMKNRKTAGPQVVVSEMVKLAEAAVVEMITDLVNQIRDYLKIHDSCQKNVFRY